MYVSFKSHITSSYASSHNFKLLYRYNVKIKPELSCGQSAWRINWMFPQQYGIQNPTKAPDQIGCYRVVLSLGQNGKISKRQCQSAFLLFSKNAGIKIDWFEIFLDQLSTLRARACSNYKHKHTAKVLFRIPWKLLLLCLKPGEAVF